MTKQYRSQVMASIHETAEGLHAAGLLDKPTMRRFDEACLTPVLLRSDRFWLTFGAAVLAFVARRFPIPPAP
jgi:putative transcriptional regulator